MTSHALRFTHSCKTPSLHIDATMSSAQLSIPAVIDVDAEVAYWRQRHADGNLGTGSGSFGHYVPWIKFACDSLITQARARNGDHWNQGQGFAQKLTPGVVLLRHAGHLIRPDWKFFAASIFSSRSWGSGSPVS